MAEHDMTIASAHARMDTHEAVCAERYENIKALLKWIVGGLVALVFGLMGWMGVQLYTLQPLRDMAAQRSNYSAYTAPQSHPN